MSGKRLAPLSFSLALALVGVVAVLWLPVLSKVEGLGASQVALAQSGTGIIRVATTGSDTPDCGSQATPCRTVQYAVDQAQAGEEIRVAAGLYTDLQGLTAPGDYLSPPASGVITQIVYVSKTVTIRGGYTTTFSDPPDAETNQTTLDAQGGGRVLFIADPSAGSGPAISPTVEGLRLTNGDAAGLGGTSWGDDYGGGVYVVNATATISNNRVFSNTADGGGGLYLFNSDTTLSGNTVTSNTADGYGGGLSLRGSDATLSDNAVTSNTTTNGQGGGLYLIDSGATLSGNTVISNTADDYGGGLSLRFSDATLSGNTVISNTAGAGGGLSLYRSDATLTNNVVTDNQANDGSGLWIRTSSPRLLHTTIARNSGSRGVLVSDGGSNYSTVALTNTILVSHTVGIDVTAGNTATLESTLWHGNTTPWSGNVIRSNDYTGDPLFDADGYHLLAGSAAVDRGVNAGVTTDIDGDPRPQGSAPDLGADEGASAPAPGGNIYLPTILKNL